MTIIGRHPPESCGCEAQDLARRHISVDEALAVIARHAQPVAEIEEVGLARAAGRVLAISVRSRGATPPFDNSAMDGYALASGAFAGDGPWLVPVLDRVPAGKSAKAPLSGLSAIRIFTGAPLPTDADSVVPQEAVRVSGSMILIDRKPAPGANIRRAGSDLASGEVVLGAGVRLGAREIAVAAAAGQARVIVRRRLRVALLVTGDEVGHPDCSRSDAQIWDVNTPMLAAAIASPTVELHLAAKVGDSRNELARQLVTISEHVDLVVTTGGVSVGEEDHVKPAVGDIGEVLFSGVAMKPGKPVSFGWIGWASWLGLPGNPMAACVTWQLFGCPLVRRLTGQLHSRSHRRHVVTSVPINRNPGRCEFRPASFVGFDMHGREVVNFEAATHSDRVGRLPHADGMILLPADCDKLPAGALVEFLPFIEN